MASSKNSKKKINLNIKLPEFSKLVTIATLVLAYFFVIFVCIEMHVTGNLDPVSYIGVGIVAMLAITVRAYMKRAYQKDLTSMKVYQAEELSKLKIKYGDNFIYETIDDVNLDG